MLKKDKQQETKKEGKLTKTEICSVNVTFCSSEAVEHLDSYFSLQVP